MSIRYEFLLKNAALPGEPKRFTDALVASGKIWRNEHGLLQYMVGPGDYVLIQNRIMLREILLSGDVVAMAGDDLDADMAWLWVTSRKFAFPRMNPERPYAPEKPLPVRYVGRVRR